MLEKKLRQYLPDIKLRIMSDHTSLDLAVAETDVLFALGYDQLYLIGLKYEHELCDYIHNHAPHAGDLMDDIMTTVLTRSRLHAALAEAVIYDVWRWANRD